MDRTDKIAWAMIVTVVAALTLIQVGMYQGRVQSAEASASGQQDLDRLRQQLSATQFDLEVEREKISILLCESGIKHNDVWGDGGRSYGIAQFQHATFKRLRNEAGRPELQWKDRDDQLWLLDWALRHGYGKYWSCFSGSGL